MKKYSMGSSKKVIVITVFAILLSTFLLWEGISFASEIGIEKISDTTISSMEKKISSNDDQLKLNENEKGVSERAPTVEYFESIRYPDGKTIDFKKQEALYQSVKDKINIKKEDAKEILKNKINSIFGDMLGISDKDIFFMELAKSKSYEWWLTLSNEKTKKNYWCVLNALTGECVLMNKVDYTGLQKPEYGSIISKEDAGKLQGDKLNLYIKKAKEIITQNYILNLESNSIKNISLNRTMYIGLRPIAEMSIVMEDGKEARMAFYTDTDQLNLIDLQ